MIFDGTEFSKTKDEQTFKRAYINKYKSTDKENKIFCIETEETVLGFPDVMQVWKRNSGISCRFYEFKYSDSKGRIKFRPSQPAFYKENSFMDVEVIAFNCKTNKVHAFSANEIFNEKSPYKINIKAEINLTSVEEKVSCSEE